jgi:hypothetical protein
LGKKGKGNKKQKLMEIDVQVHHCGHNGSIEDGAG